MAKTHSPTFSSLDRPICTTGRSSPFSIFRTAISERGSVPTMVAANSRRSLSRTTTSSRSEEYTSELQSRENLVCRLLLEKKNMMKQHNTVVAPLDLSSRLLASVDPRDILSFPTRRSSDLDFQLLGSPDLHDREIITIFNFQNSHIRARIGTHNGSGKFTTIIEPHDNFI